MCSYLVARARNEKLARHLLSNQPVAAGPRGKLLVIKVLLLIEYRSKALTLREHTWSSHQSHPLRLSRLLSLRGLGFRTMTCVYNLQIWSRTIYKASSWKHNMFRSEIMALGPKVTSIKYNKLQQCIKYSQRILGTMPRTILMLLHERTHPIPTIPFSLQRGNYSHMDGGIMDGWWRGVGDGDDLLRFPVPVGCQNGVSGSRIGVSGGGGAAELFLEKRRTTPPLFLGSEA